MLPLAKILAGHYTFFSDMLMRKIVKEKMMPLDLKRLGH
jgi:hypothetical protein